MITMIIYSPIFKLGVYLRIDQIIMVLLLPFFILLTRYKINAIMMGLIVLALFFLCIGAINAFVSGGINTYWLLNQPGKLLFAALWVSLIGVIARRSDNYLLINTMTTYLWVAISFLSLLAIIQIAEQIGFFPGMSINRMLAALYPYRSELTVQGLISTGGLQIARLGIGQATGTMDGHSILFGDFMAFILVFLAFSVRGRIRYIFNIIGILALVASLSRGAWLGYLFGIGVYAAFLIGQFVKGLVLRMSFKKSYLRTALLGTLTIGIASAALFMTPLSDPFEQRILRTNIPFIMHEGVAEGRMTSVWPSAIAQLNEGGRIGWLLGVPGGYRGPTDSQYFYLLVNVGLIGCFFFIFAHLLLVRLGFSFYKNWRSHDPAIAQIGIGYSCSVITLLGLYVVHPTLQNERLLSLLLLLTMIIFSYRSPGVNRKVTQ